MCGKSEGGIFDGGGTTWTRFYDSDELIFGNQLKRDWFATTMCATNDSLARRRCECCAAVDTQIIGIHFVELITCARSIHSQRGTDFVRARALDAIADAVRSATIANFTVVSVGIHCIALHASTETKWSAMNPEQKALCGQRHTVHALPPTGKNNSISIWCEHSSRCKRCIYAKIDRIAFHHLHRLRERGRAESNVPNIREMYKDNGDGLLH